MRVTAVDLASLNERHKATDPVALLTLLKRAFGGRIAILSSMQRAGTILCHMADKAKLSFDVLFVDTGVLHVETLQTRDRLAQTHPNLHVVTLTPAQTFAQQTSELGLLYINREGQERCCDLRKTQPLLTARGKYDALVSGLRKDEGGRRVNVELFGLDSAMNAMRVHPLAHLTSEDLDHYVGAHPDVVVNPLHEMGFPTVGCFPCTTPVRPDEPERAGRWRHLANVEYCGVNPIDRGPHNEAIDLDERYADLWA